MPPSLQDLTRAFARIGLLSFGGPAAQISLMHREIVDERQWVTEKEYLSALSFCMLLPGPEAMQLATWIVDWDQRLRMTRRFQLRRASDGVTLLRAQTTFVCIELSSGKPKRMPAEFVEGYGAAIVCNPLAAQ